MYKSISAVVYKSLPNRFMDEWLLMMKVMYRSPFGPPFTPGPPCPDIFIVCPFSIPAGTVILMFLQLTFNVSL